LIRPETSQLLFKSRKIHKVSKDYLWVDCKYRQAFFSKNLRWFSKLFL
jgi:hypothetical protein